MPTFAPSTRASLPPASRSRLRHARLRRPTALPTLLATTVLGRVLNRWRGLLGGR